MDCKNSIGLPEFLPQSASTEGRLRLLTAMCLVEVKGHRYGEIWRERRYAIRVWRDEEFVYHVCHFLTNRKSKHLMEARQYTESAGGVNLPFGTNSSNVMICLVAY